MKTVAVALGLEGFLESERARASRFVFGRDRRRYLPARRVGLPSSTERVKVLVQPFKVGPQWVAALARVCSDTQWV